MTVGVKAHEEAVITVEIRVELKIEVKRLLSVNEYGSWNSSKCIEDTGQQANYTPA